MSAMGIEVGHGEKGKVNVAEFDECGDHCRNSFAACGITCVSDRLPVIASGLRRLVAFAADFAVSRVQPGPAHNVLVRLRV